MEKRKKKNNCRLGWLLSGLVVVIVCLVVANLIVGYTGSGSNDGSEAATDEENSGQLARVKEEKERIIKETDEALSGAHTDEEKSGLYAQRAGDLYNLSLGYGGMQEEVLMAAYEAERLYPTAKTAYFIYIFEDYYGDKEKAAKYLEIAEARGIRNMPGGG